VRTCRWQASPRCIIVARNMFRSTPLRAARGSLRAATSGDDECFILTVAFDMVIAVLFRVCSRR